MKTKNNTFINTRITAKERKEFDKLAEAQERTPTDLLRILIKDFISGGLNAN